MKESASAKTGLTSKFCGSVFVNLRFDRKYALCLHPAVEGSFAISPEWLKVAMEAMVLEAGVHLRLHTRVCGGERSSPSGWRVAQARRIGLAAQAARAMRHPVEDDSGDDSR